MKEKFYTVPEWVLKDIENTLRIAYNNRDLNNECCFDRDVKCCLNCVRKILNNIELTGMERLEKILIV